MCIKKNKKDTEEEELEGSIQVHIPEALLEGAGTVTMSPPRWQQSECQTAGVGGGRLCPLHHSWTLLSPLQLVVLKQALISRDTMSSMWESQ